MASANGVSTLRLSMEQPSSPLERYRTRSSSLFRDLRPDPAPTTPTTPTSPQRTLSPKASSSSIISNLKNDFLKQSRQLLRTSSFEMLRDLKKKRDVDSLSLRPVRRVSLKIMGFFKRKGNDQHEEDDGEICDAGVDELDGREEEWKTRQVDDEFDQKHHSTEDRFSEAHTLVENKSLDNLNLPEPPIINNFDIVIPVDLPEIKSSWTWNEEEINSVLKASPEPPEVSTTPTPGDRPLSPSDRSMSPSDRPISPTDRPLSPSSSADPDLSDTASDTPSDSSTPRIPRLSFDSSEMYWVPARLHPEVNPSEFKTWVASHLDSPNELAEALQKPLSTSPTHGPSPLRRAKSFMEKSEEKFTSVARSATTQGTYKSMPPVRRKKKDDDVIVNDKIQSDDEFSWGDDEWVAQLATSEDIKVEEESKEELISQRKATIRKRKAKRRSKVKSRVVTLGLPGTEEVIVETKEEKIIDCESDQKPENTQSISEDNNMTDEMRHRRTSSNASIYDGISSTNLSDADLPPSSGGDDGWVPEPIVIEDVFIDPHNPPPLPPADTKKKWGWLSNLVSKKSKLKLQSQIQPETFAYPADHSLPLRYPLHIEKQIYKMSHVKLADYKRTLLEQVLISNFMLYIISVHADVTLNRKGPRGRKGKQGKRGRKKPRQTAARQYGNSTRRFERSGMGQQQQPLHPQEFHPQQFSHPQMQPHIHPTTPEQNGFVVRTDQQHFILVGRPNEVMHHPYAPRLVYPVQNYTMFPPPELASSSSGVNQQMYINYVWPGQQNIGQHNIVMPPDPREGKKQKRRSLLVNSLEEEMSEEEEDEVPLAVLQQHRRS